MLTISRNIKLHKVFKVLNVGRYTWNFIVTQPKTSQFIQPKEILEKEISDHIITCSIISYK